jgi:hypothetical protein
LQAEKHTKTCFLGWIDPKAHRNSIWTIHKILTYTYLQLILDLGNAKSFKDMIEVFQIQFFTAHETDNSRILIDNLESLANLSSKYQLVVQSEVCTTLIPIEINASTGQDQIYT